MSKRLLAGTAIVGGLATLAAFAVPVGAATTNATATGPSTSTAPYVLPTASGVDITSLLTVSDSGAATNGYEMVGIPDGLGARFTAGRAEVFMNHELPADRGVVRAHGKKGAFVSKLTVNPATNEVVAGADLIQPGVRFYDYLTDTYASAPNAVGTNQTTGEAFPAYPAAFGRFCSASLTDPFQLFNLRTGRGDLGQIYFGNEESGNEGRTFGITTGGQAQQLPRLGLFSWENTLVARNQSDTTVAIGMEDSADGQLHVYRGNKQRAGTIFDKAGFTNGSQAVVRVGGGPLTDAGVRALIAADADGKVPFDLSDVPWNQSGAEQSTESRAEGQTLNRIEDGTWDSTDKNTFYLVTTEGGVGATSARDGGGLWRLTFADVENPAAGGTLELLLDGSEAIGLTKPDNITIDAQGGHLLIQEDPGNNAHVARIVAYRIADGATGVVATFDPALFTSGSPAFLTQDEESSGVIDVTSTYVAAPRSARDVLAFVRDRLALARGGLFLLDAQIHTATGLDNPTAQVERGQLLLMRIADWRAVYGS